MSKLEIRDKRIETGDWLSSKLRSRSSKLNTKGIIVPTMVFIMLILTVSALALSTFAINHFSRISDSVAGTGALLTAEAGTEQTLYQLNQNNSFRGYATEEVLFSRSTQGRGTY